jgi:hypothetical protein
MLGTGMVASVKSIEQMVQILLRYNDKKKARALVRELYHEVEGSKSLMETLMRVAQRLEEEE